MLKVKRILMDHLSCPMGCEGMPGLIWQIESDRQNVVQEAWQVQLSMDASFSSPFYDTGRTEGDDSANVYLDAVLPPLSRIFVRVRVWACGAESPWSDPAFFVTCPDKDSWRASFITAEGDGDWRNSGGTYLRRSFDVKKEIREAWITSTALGLYQLSVNGVRVGDEELTPGWTDYRYHLCYQLHDVTALLGRGENVIGAHVGAGWYKGMMGFIHERCNWGDRTAFLAQLTLRYTDGSEETVVTDTSWLGASSPVTFSEIYDGERYDARLEQAGWDRPGFVPPMGPERTPFCGEGLRDRSQSPYSREEKEALRAAAREYVPEDTLWRPAAAVERPLSSLTPQPGAMCRTEMTLPARLLITPKGERVLDFGQNLTGHIRFTVDGKAGETVHLCCFETLDAAGNAYFDNLRGALQEIRYICRGGRAVYDEKFSFQGFRYALVGSFPGELDPGDFTACVIHSDMEETGHFSSSDPLLDRLQSNIEWSLRGNFVDIPTDCPQRDERMGWTGDAQIFSRTACFLRNCYSFYRKWLKDVAFDQTPEGGVPHMVPDMMSFYPVDDWLLSQGTHSAAAWADVAVILPWTMYLTYGDRRILEEQFESMKKWIDFMHAHSRDLIWNYKLQFGDWVALDAAEGSYWGATPNDLTCTAYFAYSTGLFSKCCRALGRTALAEEYEKLYAGIVKKFRDTFLDENGVMKVPTQTAHILALYFRLLPPEGIRGTAEGLKKLLDAHGGHLVTGFVGTPYFCHALSENGYADAAWDLIFKKDFPSWLYQVTRGATTVWEHWDGLKPDGTMWSPDMNSFNHYAYGAIREWLCRKAAGIELDEEAPGCKRILFSPVTTGRLDHAAGSFESVYGTVSSKWKRTGDRYECEFTVPPNARCRILLEEGARDAVSSLPFQRDERGRLYADTGSGVWTCAYCLDRKG